MSQITDAGGGGAGAGAGAAAGCGGNPNPLLVARLASSSETKAGNGLLRRGKVTGEGRFAFPVADSRTGEGRAPKLCNARLLVFELRLLLLDP